MSNLSSTAEDILSSARALIIAGGYNGFSYADIADVVGIRKPSIHHHFPSKAELVRTLVARYREDVQAGLSSLERNVPTPLGQLQHYVGYWEACITDASLPFCACALLATEIPVLPEAVALEVRAHFRALSTWIASVLERGQQSGDFRLRGTPVEEAEAFMATVHGAMLSARAYGDPGIFGVITGSLLDRLTGQA